MDHRARLIRIFTLISRPRISPLRQQEDVTPSRPTTWSRRYATAVKSISRPCGVTWKNSGIVRVINSMSGARSKVLRFDGISDELCTKYSQRRGEIEERIADFKAEHGREPTTAEIHVIAKETRTSKLIEISTEAVRAQQRQRASAEELAQIDRVKAQAYARQKSDGEHRRGRACVSCPGSSGGTPGNLRRTWSDR